MAFPVIRHPELVSGSILLSDIILLLFPQISLIAAEIVSIAYIFNPRFNSPDGSGNPFWVIMIVYKKRFPRGF
jgi:hypothetical protein